MDDWLKRLLQVHIRLRLEPTLNGLFHQLWILLNVSNQNRLGESFSFERTIDGPFKMTCQQTLNLQNNLFDCFFYSHIPIDISRVLFQLQNFSIVHLLAQGWLNRFFSLVSCA